MADRNEAKNAGELIPEPSPLPVTFALPKASMTLEEGARYLGVSRPYLEQLIKAGKLRPHNLQAGGDRRVSSWEIIRYVAEREAAGCERKG